MTGKYQWELFDLVKDPEEMNNLYHKPKHKELREEMSCTVAKAYPRGRRPGTCSQSYKRGKKDPPDRPPKKGSKQTVVAYGTSLTKVGMVDQLRTVFNQQLPGQVNLINGAQGGAN